MGDSVGDCSFAAGGGAGSQLHDTTSGLHRTGGKLHF